MAVGAGAAAGGRQAAARYRPIASRAVTVLFTTHAAYLEHLAGPRHPERPERLNAAVSYTHLTLPTSDLV